MPKFYANILKLRVGLSELSFRVVFRDDEGIQVEFVLFKWAIDLGLDWSEWKEERRA